MKNEGFGNVVLFFIIAFILMLTFSWINIYFWEQDIVELHNNTPEVFDAPVSFMLNTHPDDYKNCILVSKNDISMTIECDSGFIGSRVSTPGSGVKRGYVYCGIPDHIIFERVW